MVVPSMATHPEREKVLKLINEKDKIEAQIKELNLILTTNNVGLRDPLVDDEGFPLSHVDVYQVRHARHKIICLQNDHKAIMKQIEKGLYEIYGQGNGEPNATGGSLQTIGETTIIPASTTTSAPLNPIARVNMVREGSPADIDGIRVDDLIVEFGSLNINNFEELMDFAKVAKHSEGIPMQVKIMRNNKLVEVSLTPRTWVGRGLLGCNILPLESVER
ncbi:26S proteasome non-ATPase regulatory subunit 9 [Chrysoperla carnea]|uniref:26S proteasome non-ATPase regulatory subunit 9 n=1 Tax=Chrysoperla carnea TaxID=189513 RepID=UPI001D0639D6|nr:26S proteasome non-ATPase regulatory subunit 9 [Chrysoperla carnea]